MSDENQSRLERIERLLESTAVVTTSHSDRLNTLENFGIRAGEVIEQNAADINRLTDRLNQVTDRIDRNAAAIDRLVEPVVDDRERFAEHQRTTEAALAKIDRVLDYLIKRDTTDNDD